VTAALVAVLLLAAVDYALVRVEAGRSPGALSAWFAGVRQTITRPALTLGIWAGAGVLLALLIGVYIALRELTTRGSVSVPSVLAVGGAFVLQQGFMFTRTWLRVGLLAAEQDVADRAREASRGRHPDPADPGSEPVVDAPVVDARVEVAPVVDAPVVDAGVEVPATEHKMPLEGERR
jgi:hypothetical protein